MSKSSNFYRAFEDRYRGSRDLIRGRLEVYLDFLRPLAGLYKNPSAVDLGCGRGEFLEVLLAAGFKPKGVDLDAGMLKACEELHLPAEKADALAFLAKLPKQSQVVVSAFHVVEHIPFEQLQTLVSEAYRVLKPGGIMILETPNPENITVATANFYLDPTHERPIPPPLLSFIGEYAGFERVKTLRLQESPELREKTDVSLADVLGGVSPDYSIVAQKAGSKKTMAALDQVFSKDYGLTSSDLANRYEESHQRALEKINQSKAAAENELHAFHKVIQMDLAEVHRRLEQTMGELGAARAEKEALGAEREAVKAELAEVRGKLEQTVGELGAARAEREALEAALENESRSAQQAVAERDALRREKETTANLLQQANEKLAATQQELYQVHQANHHHHLLAQERQQRIDELLRSTSWRVTSPLRKVKRAALVFRAPDGRPTFAYVGKHAKLYIERRPRLRKATSALSPAPTKIPTAPSKHLSQHQESRADKSVTLASASKVSSTSCLGEALLVAKDRIDANPSLRRFVLRVLERFPGLKFWLRRRYLAQRAGVAHSLGSLSGCEVLETSWKQGQSGEPLSTTPTDLELIIARECRRVAGASMQGGTPLQRYIWKTERPQS